MSKPKSIVKEALDLIRNADLSHPDAPLLECFVEDSLDQEFTARYLLRRCRSNGASLDFVPLLSDWKHLIAKFTDESLSDTSLDEAVISNIKRRDGGKCCITGFDSSLFDPLIVAPVLGASRIQIDKDLSEVLGVFLGPETRDWLLFKAASLDAHRNHWLVRKSAAAALRKGFFEIDLGEEFEMSVSVVTIGSPALYPPILDKIPMIRFCKLSNQTVPFVDSPDFNAIQIVSRFAKSIRWSLVAREISKKATTRATDLGPPSLWRRSSDSIIAFMSRVLRLFPKYIRIRAYQGLAFLGAHIYGPSCSIKTQRLPFGMYLKTTELMRHQGLANEYAALQLIKRHTHLPVPRALDLTSDSDKSYLLISRVPDVHLGLCIDMLTNEEEKNLISDLQKFVGTMRSIPKHVAPGYAITNTLGEACYDHRINMGRSYDDGQFVGPFETEEDFNKITQVGALPHVSHRSGHDVVFTHGDLNTRNIVMRDGRLSGVIDWENSGFYPEYWDLTKAHFITKVNWRWLRIIDKVFEPYGDYADELATEWQIWWYCY